MRTTQKIMVIDDDPVVGKSFERVLASKGYAVINCHSGEEALAKLQNEEYDAVFTDLKMPGMDGMEVAALVKERQPWMPVIIVTGFGSEIEETKAKNLGVSEFMHKPLSPDMIERSADSAMNAKKAVVEIVEEAIVASPEPELETKSPSLLKNMALFLCSPFVGLLYAMLLPFVGLAMLLYMGGKLALKNESVRKVAKLIASPFIGLAYAVCMPFIGLGALAYYGVKAALKQ